MKPNMDLRISYFPGKFIQGNNAIIELPKYIDLLGGDPFLLVTPSMEAAMRKHGYDRYAMELFRGQCCWDEINGIIGRIKDKGYSVIVGVGGGRIVDTAKAVADQLNINTIIVPTVASSSAAFSACSVIYSPEGVEESVYYEKHSPNVLLLDNTLITGASCRHFIAGMGDALAVYFEGRGCVSSGAANSLHARQTFCAMAMCDYCLKTLLRCGETAVRDYRNKMITPAVERIIELNLLCAGIAFEGAGLAAAHAIHNGLTILPEVRRYLHGEVVAFGVLCELHLTRAASAELEQIIDFCQKVGLPTTFAEIGIADPNRQTLAQVAQAVFDDPYLHHESGDIRPEDIHASMLAIDAAGRARRSSAG